MRRHRTNQVLANLCFAAFVFCFAIRAFAAAGPDGASARPGHVAMRDRVGRDADQPGGEQHQHEQLSRRWESFGRKPPEDATAPHERFISLKITRWAVNNQ